MAPSPKNSVPKNLICKQCDKALTTTSRNIPCPKCSAPYHTACAKLQQTLQNGGFSKCCESSNNNKSTMISTNQSSLQNNSNVSVDMLRNLMRDVIKETNEELFSRVKAEISIVSDSVVALQHQLGEVNNAVENHETRLNILEKSANANTAFKELESIHREVSERMHRAKNVIIFNVPEKGGSHDDLTFINQEMSSFQEPLSARSIYRLGKSGSNSQPRPLKVSFDSENDARSLLRNKRFLSTHNFRARSDQTLSQRTYLRDLQAQLDDRKKQGENNLTIKYIAGTPTIVQQENA